MGDKTGDKSKTRPRRRTQHPRPETSWETRPETRERRDQGGGRSTPAKMGDKLGGKSKTRLGRRTQHPRPETSWETRPETRERRDQGGGRSTPAQMGDKLGDKSKTRLGRRTQHPRPETSWETRPETRGRRDQRRGHSIPAKADTLKTALRTPTVNCLGKKACWICWEKMEYSFTHSSRRIHGPCSNGCLKNLGTTKLNHQVGGTKDIPTIPSLDQTTTILKTRFKIPLLKEPLQRLLHDKSSCCCELHQPWQMEKWWSSLKSRRQLYEFGQKKTHKKKKKANDHENYDYQIITF